MASTRWYLTNRTAPFTPATLRGVWNDTAAAVTKALDSGKAFGGASTTVARAETSATNPFAVLLYRGVSGPLGAQTISGTINVCIGVLESSASADFNWKIHVYVTQGDTDTPRGTLLNAYVETAGTNEWPTTAQGFALTAAQALSSLAISAGDRVVVEVGFIARNTVTTSFTGTLRYGTVDANGGDLSDLTVGNTSVATLAGFVDFSLALAETTAIRTSQLAVEALTTQGAAPALRASQLAVEALTTQGPAPALRASQLVVEALTLSAGTPGLRISQLIIETLTLSTLPSVTRFNALLVSP